MPCMERKLSQIDPAVLQKVLEHEHAILECYLKTADEVPDAKARAKACNESVPEMSRDANDAVCFNWSTYFVYSLFCVV